MRRWDGGPEDALNLLSRMTASLASTANLDEMCEAVLEQIVNLGFGAVWVAVLDEPTGNLITLREVIDGRDTTHEMPAIFALDTRQPVGHGFRQRKMINVKDVDTLAILDGDEDTVPPGRMALPRVIFEHLRGHPFACGPLLGSRGQPVGAVGLSSYRGCEPIPDEVFEAGLLRAFMDHLGIAIERALHLRRLERLNAELVEAQEQLANNARMRAVGELAAAVAHDLNNLSGIAMMASSVGHRSPQDAAEALPRIDRALRAIADLVAGLQRVARTGSSDAPLTAVDLAAVIDDVVVMLAAICREEEITVEVDVPEPTFVHADPTTVQQIVTNLMLNARDALGTVAPERRHLSVRVTEAGDEVSLVVADTGPGIPAAILDRVFEPFVTGKSEGHPGLGLATVAANAKHFGGGATAKNRAGGGAEIEVQFVRASPPEVQAAPARAPAPDHGGASLSILAIDDEPDVVDIVVTYLEPLGYRVVTATSADAGLALAMDGRFDVILCDVGMPGKNGLELCRDLRERGIDSKLVLMTGWDENRVRADPRGLDADAVLQKPYVGPALLELLESVSANR